MEPKEFSENVKQCIKELEERVPDFILSFGNNIVAIVKERITQRGEGKDGKFKKYTKKYNAYKTKAGKNQGFRDLTFTGGLMKNFKTYKEGKNYEMGFSNDYNKDLADWNSTYAGVDNVIEPKESEVNEEIDIFQAEIMKILLKYLA